MTDLREQIAQIIDPEAFDPTDVDYPLAISRAAVKQNTARTKADAVLALLAHSIPERGATRCKHHCGCECLTSYENRVEDLEDEIRHLKSLSTPAPEGEWVMVPKEPTPEMTAAGVKAWKANGYASIQGVWSAMIAAAPAPVRGVEECPPSMPEASPRESGVPGQQQAAMGDDDE